MRSLKIVRANDNGTQTIGMLAVIEADKVLHTAFTLELPYKNNDKKISCIPIGKYTVVKRVSPKFGECFHVLNVPNRDWILIHQGNYHSQILGCILVGTSTADINKDGFIDVLNSKKEIKNLLKLLPDKFELTIL